MGFRDPLDVSEYVRQYDALGGSSTAGAPRIDTAKPWWEQAPGAFEAEERARKAAENAPQVQGYGPLTASTCQDLVPAPLLCWDVLGYYRTLGVHWKATKKDLMKAYQALGPMPSAWQTHCFKQLLDPAIRRDYDMVPLGQEFLGDPFVQQRLKNRAAKEASRRSQAGTPTTAKDVIEEQYKLIPDDPEDGLDSTTSDGPDSEASDNTPWPFAYFTLKSRSDKTDVLAEWQSMLIRAVAAQGEILSVAVGFVGKQPNRFLVGSVGALQVAFLNDKECPTEALASAAALALINDMKRISSQKHHR